MKKTIKVPKHKLKGDDEYKVFSVRLPIELHEDLERLVQKTDLSRNQVVTILLRDAISMAEIDEDE